MEREVPKGKELEDRVADLLSGYFTSEEELKRHIAFVMFLTSDAMCAKFGRQTTINMLKALIHSYSDEADLPNAEWVEIKKPSNQLH